ncbi:hypothetical protein N7463_007454 [Penicillium fimorum]|uniref:Uncharacterized protein n=1 Tax=Penicillium fimorum TaxID=1882269 RepID=A0A9W9XWA2_9EURO|nr:hypothetical protein N7463_007454 [Penicillium fimorum]
MCNIGNFTTYKPPLYQNPSNIGFFNFLAANYANISNIHVKCELVSGVPQDQTPGESIMFNDPGSNWSILLYSCPTGIKATIKTVSFRFNGTDDLSGLKRVENSHFLLRDGAPLWGLVSAESAGKPGLSTLRNEHLWLPGTGDLGVLSTEPRFQNLPGVDYYRDDLAGAFEVDLSSTGAFDYSGMSIISLLLQWQNLSRTLMGMVEALNLT